MPEKYLPIGTIVKIKGAEKKLMINAFCSIAEGKPDVVFDYSGVMYPEGSIVSNQVCLFNHDKIEKVLFMGYQDEEEKIFKENLKLIVEETIKMISNKNQ